MILIPRSLVLPARISLYFFQFGCREVIPEVDEEKLFRTLIASLDHRYTLRHAVPEGEQIVIPDLVRGEVTFASAEVEDWVAGWGEEGELDFLDEFIRLTLHTACHCLLGPDFRYKMTEEFKRLYHKHKKGLQAIAFVDPYLQQPIFEARDKARAGGVQ